MTDKVNSTTIEDEFYDEATEAFPSINDLVPGANNRITEQINGRLVAIWVKDNGVGKGDNGPYDYTNALVLVLDDGEKGDQATDLIPAAPWEGPLRFSTIGTQTRLAPRVDGMTKAKKDEDGNVIVPSVPMKFRPYIGRINARPNQKQKNGSPPIGIATPVDSDKPIIMKYKSEIVEINERLAAKAAEAEDAKAFE